MSLEQPWKEYTRCTVWVLRLCIIFLITSFSSLSATGPHRRHDRLKIEHNNRALDRARTAIDEYRGVLKRKRERVNGMLKDAAAEAKVARSMWRTLEHVMGVVDIASTALDEFNSLSQLSARDLLPLDDEKLYNDYLDISRSLAVKLAN